MILLGIVFAGVTYVHAATPKDPFNENPIVSSGTPIAQLEFDQAPLGVMPSTLEALVLNGHASSTWGVRGDPHDAAHRTLTYGEAHESTPNDPTDLSFDDEKPSADHRAWAAALVKNASLDAGDVSVAFKISPGADARTGFVYRYGDPSSFYLLECDAGGEFFTVYRVQKGKWKVVNRISGVITPDVWHTLRLIFQLDTYVVFFDNEMMIAGRDKTILTPGRVGLIVVADGSTSFNHLVLRAPATVALPAATPAR